MPRSFPIVVFLLGMVWVLSRCSHRGEKDEVTTAKDEWLNWNDTVSYVGLQSCASCHSDVRHTFLHTGMGQSFGEANPEKAFFDWDGSEIIHDSHGDLYYKPYFRDSVLMVNEFRLFEGDTIHLRTDTIEYIIGSGQHTNSHIFEVGGYLYQAPFTYYTQEGRSGLPPGYEDGNNSRFSRKIGLECMSCHNAMPTGFELGSENRFKMVPLGIDCERCHGPGELHVAQKMAGILVDTSKEADRSIVNPARLTPDRQMELCQRCHLQGNAILKEGKSFFDFLPGMKLSDVMDVYLPRYNDSEESFIMASHVDRFKQSECFLAGEGNFTCVSCHNPHVSVRETNHENFNLTCGSCHGKSTSALCTESESVRLQAGNDCVSCHMPSSGSIDIPHVTVHDHLIKVHPEKKESEKDAERIFQTLVAINNPDPDIASKAGAYLNQFERFGGESLLLDSAWKYVKQLSPDKHPDLYVRYFYLRDQPVSLASWVDARGGVKLLGKLTKRSYDNKHAWTAYRIGEAYSGLGSRSNALAFYRRSVELAPFVNEFRNKLGTSALLIGDIQTARDMFEEMVQSDPSRPEGHGNLGYLCLMEGDTIRALQLFDRALELNPDYEPARLNKVSVLVAQRRYDEARLALRPLHRKHPDNERINAMWRELTSVE